MCLFLKMVLRSWNAFLAWAIILILISLIDLPSLAMRGPRYLNFSTCCNTESLNLMLHFGIACFLEMTMVTVLLVFRPPPDSSRLWCSRDVADLFWCYNKAQCTMSVIMQESLQAPPPSLLWGYVGTLKLGLQTPQNAPPPWAFSLVVPPPPVKHHNITDVWELTTSLGLQKPILCGV